MTVEPAPVHIAQDPAELEPLLELYRERRPSRVLEVGTFHGGTLYHWLRNAPPGALVVSVDRYDLVDNSESYGAWAADGVEWAVIRGDSHDPLTVAQAERLGPFEWIYIDAGHLEWEVRADWHAYRPLAASSAVVAFHDVHPSADPSIHVDPLWAELRDEYSSIELPGTFGTGVLFLDP